MKLFSKIFALLLLSSVFLIGCTSDDNSSSDSDIIEYEELPLVAREFISLHFSDQEVIKVEKKIKVGIDNKRYEVDLTNDIEVGFDDLGEWTKVETNKYLPVPKAIIPELISEYVAKTFPKNSIKEIEKKNYGYAVELANDIDLRFGPDGNFIGVNY